MSHLADVPDTFAAVMQYWPVFAFTFALFLGSISTAVGLTLWIVGKLASQDARRIEMKEAILLEIRERHHTLFGRIEQQAVIFDEKIDEVKIELKDHGNRLTKLETAIENGTRFRRSPREG